jgi:hypothetical protein
MGFWGKLGKIALTAAPYVAAPFTGGASLAFTGLANQAVGAWNAKDAQKRAAQGLGPSSFDRAVGMAGNIGSLAGGAGAFGKIGGQNFSGQNFTGNNQNLSGWQGALSKAGGIANQLYGSGMLPQFGGSGVGQSYEPTSGQQPIGGSNQAPGMNRFNRQARRTLGPVMGNMNQSNPNLAEGLASGRMEAIKNQPWRGGYDTQVLGNDDESIITSRMPTISPFQRRQQQFSYTPPGTPAAVEDYGEAPEEVMGVEERRRRGIA